MRKPQGGGSGQANTYNEVMIHDFAGNEPEGIRMCCGHQCWRPAGWNITRCFTSRLPGIVEALFVRAEDEQREQHLGYARAMRTSWTRHFGLVHGDGPLLLEYNKGEGFVMVD